MVEETITRYTLEDVGKHNEKGSPWVIIHDNVYDMTNFLDEHPGGEEVLLDVAGTVATEQFEDVGHSTDARTLLKEYLIGELVEEDKQNTTDTGAPTWGSSAPEESSSLMSWVIPVLVGTLVTLLYKFYLAPQK